jgi:cytochrome b
MGGWSVLALLFCLLALIGFGLFAVDTDGLNSGPLADFVDYDKGRSASHWHGFAFTLLEILVGLHLLAILFYQLVKRHRLIEAMVTGCHSDPDRTNEMRPGSRWILAASLLLGAGVFLLLVRLSG